MKLKSLHLFMTQLCAAFSINILLILLTILVNQNSGSIALLMILTTLPALFLSPPIGAALDHESWKKPFLLFTAIDGSIIIFLIASGNFTSNLLLYMLTFSSQTLDIFIRLVLQVEIGRVKRKELLRENARLNLAENIGVIAGPVIAGVLSELKLFSGSFILVLTLTMLTSVFLTSINKIEKQQIPKTSASNQEPIFQLAKNTRLRHFFLSLGSFTLAIGIINTEQIAFTTSHYSTTSFGYSLTESMWGLGMVLGCFLLIFLEKRIKSWHIYQGSVLFAGIFVLLLTAGKNLIAAQIFFILLGIVNILIVILSTTFIQEISRKEVVGKSLAFKTVFVQIFSISGMGLAGIGSNFFSSLHLYQIAAGVLLVTEMVLLIQKKIV